MHTGMEKFMIYKKLSTYLLCMAVFCCIGNNVYGATVEALNKKIKELQATMAKQAQAYRDDLAVVEKKHKSLLAENKFLTAADLVTQFAEYRKNKENDLQVWQQDLCRREFDYINAERNLFFEQNAVGLGRLESDVDALARIDALTAQNADIIKENKRLKGQGGTLTTAARYIDNGDYKQALTTLYNDIVDKAHSAYDTAHDVYTMAVDFVSKKPYETGAVVAGVSWLSIVYVMRSSYAVLTRPYSISSCMAELPVAQLESLDQGGVTEMLIDYIYTTYRTSHDEYKVGSAYIAESRFYKDLLAELYAAECYMWWGSVIPHWILRKPFLFNESLYSQLPERIERLHYYKRLFLRWVDARNDAAAQPAGPGFGGGLSGLLG